MQDLSGMRFGEWSVISFVRFDKSRISMWKCRCACGVERIVNGRNLKNGSSKSCGCLQRKIVSKTSYKHGQSRSLLYQVWGNMIQRCTNENTPGYKDYGGKGVSVCAEWLKDSNSFLKWARMNGYEKGLTLDRKNNDGDYEPSNCRWVTQKEQSYNKSNNRILTFRGKSKTLTEWCSELGLKPTTVSARLKRGRTVEESLTLPIGKG